MVLSEPRTTPTELPVSAAAACPYCAALLDPAPERGRLCPRCRRPIVVRRVGGRRVLLTQEALEVFEAERDRESNESAWTTARSRWLGLAKGVSAPVNRVARLGAVPPSEAAVVASQNLYLAAAERAVRTARRDKRWDEVARIRRTQAAALYRASGSAIPPPDEIVTLHRAWSAAALRSLVGFGAQVELVATGCCAICGRDNGRAFRIAAELRTQRLPHVGCPKGLCACDWWPLPETKARRPGVRRQASPRAGAAPAPVADAAVAPVADAAFGPVADAAGGPLQPSSPTRHLSVDRPPRPRIRTRRPNRRDGARAAVRARP